jgi:hypothetical protein
MLTWGLMTWTKSTEAAGNLMPPPYDSVPSAPPASAFDVSSSTQQNKAHASRERARTGGFQNTRWGMSPEQVRNLYADVEASSPDILSTKRSLAGHPATVRFGFLGGQLMQVHLELVRSETTNPPSDVFGHFKALLGQKYGQPLTQGDMSVTWSAEGSTIELLAPGEEGMPVKLVYMRGNDMNTVTKDL